MSRTTFALPEVIYGPSLVICPHIFLFAMLFHAKAFRNPRLTSMTQVWKLFIGKGCEQLVLPLQREVADWYIFCKMDTVRGVATIQ